MTRPFSSSDPKELRDTLSIGIQEAKYRIEVSKILDRLDGASSWDVVRHTMLDFIKLTTGIK